MSSWRLVHAGAGAGPQIHYLASSSSPHSAAHLILKFGQENELLWVGEDNSDTFQ